MRIHPDDYLTSLFSMEEEEVTAYHDPMRFLLVVSTSLILINPIFINWWWLCDFYLARTILR